MNTKSFKNITTNQLKEEYIQLCFGAMIYDVDTERRRKEICAEIERRLCMIYEEEIYNENKI